MSHRIVHSLPFHTRIPKDVRHAKHILARDQARAQKLLSGLHPHGPLHVHALRKKHHFHLGRGSGSTTSDPQVDPAAGARSIDVTDSGM